MLNPAFKRDTTFRRKTDKGGRAVPAGSSVIVNPPFVHLGPDGVVVPPPPAAAAVVAEGEGEEGVAPAKPVVGLRTQDAGLSRADAEGDAPAQPVVVAAPAKPAALPSGALGGIVSTERLSKTYGRREVVHEVNISVRAGEIVGLLGPNGAGKTTSFYMIVGLIPATTGKVFLDGRDVTRLPMWQRARLGLGYLPQEASIFRKLTVWENVMAIVETMDMPSAQRKTHTAAMLEELGLARLAKQPAYTLSGGERRRLEIARALATRPRFMLLDEPFSGVDPISVADVQNIVRDLKNRGIGVLITDHNVRETLSIVDRAYLIHQGRVFVEGTSEFVINDPMSRKFYLGEGFKM